MKLLLLFYLISASAALELHTSNRGTYTFQFGTPTTRRLNDQRPKASQQQYVSNAKKQTGIPPYAVSMEPLVQYSQPDPLYVQEKQNLSVIPSETRNDLIKNTYVKEESQNLQISSKAGTAPPYPDSEVESTHNVEEPSYGYYHGPAYHEDPEPIIEIIIKESNQSLPAPPPISVPPKKKKKEPVQVFYVKYKKDPNSHYGEDKVIYEAPVPAITPPTNNDDGNHSHEYEEEVPQHHEEVTYAPPPSTTLKAIIRPDSETYHGSGLHITFGESKHPEEEHSHDHPGEYHQQSAPQPSVVFPHTVKNTATSRTSLDAQPSKRNPTPYQPPTQNPQQLFHNTPRPSHGPFGSSQNFQRQTPLPTFQQAPHFPPQSFKTQYQKPVQSFASQNIHHSTVQRPQPTQAYTTLPQNLQFQTAQPGHHHFGPSRIPPPQPTAQSQQYHTINQHHLRQNFQNSARPTQTQQYHTINHQTAPSTSYRPITTTTNRFSQPTITPPNPFRNQQRPFENRPPFPEPAQHHQQSTFSNVQQRPSVQPFHAQQQPQPFAQYQQQKPQFQQQPVQHQQIRHQPVQHQQQPQHQQFQQQPQHQQFPHQQQQQQQFQHQQQVEQLNRLQQEQQRLQQQIQQQQRQHQQLIQQQQSQSYKLNSAPEIIKSISPDIPFQNPIPEVKKPVYSTPKPAFLPTLKPGVQYSTSKPQYQTSKSVPYTVNYKTTTEAQRYTQTTEAPIEYVTEDPKKVEEENRKKEERKKQNVAALPQEVPDDLRQQLLSSGILGNADIQILDYDKIGDIPIESLPPEALANFQQVAGSEPKPAVTLPDSSAEEDSIAAGSENEEVSVESGRHSGEQMEMKVVRFNPDSKEGANVANNYMKEGATQLDPVVLNDSKYNRYLPLKVAGAQFPVPDVPELRGRNVTSVVVLAPVDYEFLQRSQGHSDSISRSAEPVLEVQGVHFVGGDILKTLVKTPSAENYRKWLQKENSTSVDKQSVVLLVLDPLDKEPSEKDIFMYDIGTQRVSKLKGELSATFVEVAESNSQNDDLEEISDSPSAPGGDFTISAGVTSVEPYSQRRTRAGTS